jgi:GMP reductase
MRIEEDWKLDFSDVLLRPKTSELQSRKDVDLLRDYTFKHTDSVWSGIGICAANMDTTGTFEMAEVLGVNNMLTALHKHYTPEQLIGWDVETNHMHHFDYMLSIGSTENDCMRFDEIVNKQGFPHFLCIDVANGYTEDFINFVSKMRGVCKDKVIIVAGNVVTGDITERLILAGADIVKVGIGSGSVCTTRLQTGVGYPQLSAVIECADAAHGIGGHIMSDGGCNNPGDVAKAFAAGADFVMSGSMFAGTDETAGDSVRDDDGNIIGKDYYGMSSVSAMDRYSGGVADYRSSEGRDLIIPYKGPVNDVVNDLLGGLRSTCTYTGCKSLKELPKRATFIKVHNQVNNLFGG